MKEFNYLKKILEANRFIVKIFLGGFVISILGVSLVISDINYRKKINFQNLGGIDVNAYQLNLKTDVNKTRFDLINLFSGIDENTYLESKVSYSVNSNVEGSNNIIGLTGIYFSEAKNLKFPILEGRMLNNEDINKGSGKIVIGKNIVGATFSQDNKTYISLHGRELEVVGIVGIENSPCIWDNETFVPMSSEIMEEFLLKENNTRLILSNYTESYDNDLDKISSNAEKLKGLTIQMQELDIEKFITEDIIANTEETSFVMLICLFAIVNLVIVSSYWIQGREKEIGIKKACGISNKNILKMLGIEFLVITIMGGVISLVIQCGIMGIVTIVFNQNLSINFNNLGVIIFYALLISGISSIIPIIKAMKINPIEYIRRI